MPLAIPISVGQVAYDATPTVTELRDALITLGLMAAYVAPPPVKGGFEFEDRGDMEWKDTEGIEFEDRET